MIPTVARAPANEMPGNFKLMLEVQIEDVLVKIALKGYATEKPVVIGLDLYR